MPEASTNHETELYTKEVSVRLANHNKYEELFLHLTHTHTQPLNVLMNVFFLTFNGLNRRTCPACQNASSV